MRAVAVACLALLLTSCASVKVSPSAVSSVPDRLAESEQAIGAWRDAVLIANAFLASDFNTTLPHGTLSLSDTGMAFLVDRRSMPFEVRCSSAGDLLLPFKMTAQERASGFVVGAVRPKKSRAIDNSFFKDLSGKPMPSSHIAALILHELAHVYHSLGTVSPWKSVRYYAEAIFLFRYRNHSMERLPYRTSDEFLAFAKHASETTE